MLKIAQNILGKERGIVANNIIEKLSSGRHIHLQGPRRSGKTFLANSLSEIIKTFYKNKAGLDSENKSNYDNDYYIHAEIGYYLKSTKERLSKLESFCAFPKPPKTIKIVIIDDIDLFTNIELNHIRALMRKWSRVRFLILRCDSAFFPKAFLNNFLTMELKYFTPNDLIQILKNKHPNQQGFKISEKNHEKQIIFCPGKELLYKSVYFNEQYKLEDNCSEMGKTFLQKLEQSSENLIDYVDYLISDGWNCGDLIEFIIMELHESTLIPNDLSILYLEVLYKHSCYLLKHDNPIVDILLLALSMKHCNLNR